MGRFETWPALTLIFLISVCMRSGLTVPVGDEISDVLSDVGQRGPTRPYSWPWRVATKTSYSHPRRTVRDAGRRSYMHRVPQDNPPEGYYVPGEFLASQGYRSQWRLTSGYAVRYKCPVKSYWLPKAVQQHSFNCDNAFVNKK